MNSLLSVFVEIIYNRKKNTLHMRKPEYFVKDKNVLINVLQ